MSLSNMDKIFPLFEAMQQHQSQYDAGDTDYSVTTLLNPPRVVHLNKRHPNIGQFVEDIMHSYTGTAIHEYTEKLLNQRFPDGKVFKCEERLRTVIHGRKISGAYDFLHEPRLCLYDMKNTSCWKMTFKPADTLAEWAKQQNMYRHMYMLKYKKELQSLRIITMYRDWSKYNKMRSGKNYPIMPCMEYRLPLMDFKHVNEYMQERVGEMIKYEDVKDDDLPECSYDDMWSEPDTVAVKSTRLKSRALRVLSSQKAADNFVAKYLTNENCKDKLSNLSFEVRPAERKRCDSWCPANMYCNQYHAHLAKKVTED